MYCNENPSYVFPEKELRGLSPNFHIHVSWTVSDLYIPRIGPLIFLQQNRQHIFAVFSKHRQEKKERKRRKTERWKVDSTSYPHLLTRGVVVEQATTIVPKICISTEME